jgi:hypothetical protein
MNTAEKHTGCLSGEIQEHTDLERKDELSFEEHCRLEEGGGLSMAHRIILSLILGFLFPAAGRGSECSVFVMLSL